MKKILILLSTMFILLTSCAGKKEDLRVGMEVGYAPFNWYQSNSDNGAVKISSGYAGGYDVQIAKIIAKKLNKNLVIVPSDWDSLLGPAVNSDKIDLVIAGMSPTTERKESMDFTDSYYESDIVVVVNKNGNYANAKTLDDFSGAKITGQLNTLHYDMIDQLNGVKKQVAMENFPAMIVALNANKIDGFVAEKPTALSLTETDSNISYIEFKDNGFKYDKNEVNVAIGLKKSNTKLLNEVNKALSEISKEDRENLMKEAIKTQPTSDVQTENNKTFFYWITYILTHYANEYLKGTGITLLLAIVGTGVGSIIGIVVAVVNTLNTTKKTLLNYFFKVLQVINKIYVNIFRGTPMIVQAMILFYGLGQVFSINLTPMTASIIIISINTGAYISEIFRGGIISIDKGQYEGAQALGFNHFQTMVYIVLPQALRNVLPSIGNEFIVNIKDSAVLFAIGVTELYTVSKQISGTNFRYYEVFIITSVIYFVLTSISTYLIKKLEQKLDNNKNYEMVE